MTWRLAQFSGTIFRQAAYKQTRDLHPEAWGGRMAPNFLSGRPGGAAPRLDSGQEGGTRLALLAHCNYET